MKDDCQAHVQALTVDDVGRKSVLLWGGECAFYKQRSESEMRRRAMLSFTLTRQQPSCRQILNQVVWVFIGCL